HEGPVALVAKQPGHPAWERLRRTVFLSAGVRPADQARVVVDVVDHDQVEPAVAIEVEEGGRGAPGRVAQAGLARDIPELAPALPVENWATRAVAVSHAGARPVVVAAPQDPPHAVPRHVEPRAGTDVAESAVLLLVQKHVARPVRPTVIQQEKDGTFRDVSAG